jgi:CheY-like chemotaxis protein
MTFRAICLTGNPLLRRTLRRTLQAAGTHVEFADKPIEFVSELDEEQAPDLIVVDPESRRVVDMDRLGKLKTRSQIVVIGESIEKEDVLTLLRSVGFNHVISDIGAEPAVELPRGQIDEDDLVVTSGKMFKGDIFGLEKYLAWGAFVHERLVKSYEEKRDVLLEIAEHAKEVGVRRQVIAKIESVTDELLMNALYDAPAIRYGVAPRISERSRAGLGPIGDEPALLRWACDDRYFAVSVRDNYGELRKDAILDHIARARAMKGSPQHKPNGGGAGLGLYFVITSVTRFIANISPGQLTEVVGLFDIKSTGREQDACAKSLHIFTTPSGA